MQGNDHPACRDFFFLSHRASLLSCMISSVTIHALLGLCRWLGHHACERLALQSRLDREVISCWPPTFHGDI